MPNLYLGDARDTWKGNADDLLSPVAAGGYTGIEIADTMIGAYAGQPDVLAKALSRNNPTLVLYACGSDSGFTEEAGLEADLAMAKRVVSVTSCFPGALVFFGSASMRSEKPRSQKFEAIARFFNGAAERGERVGVAVAVYPSFASQCAAVYPRRPRPDVPAARQWQILGDNTCDAEAVIDRVQAAPHFNGWPVPEEESREAGRDPAAVIAKNRERLCRIDV